MSEPRTFPLPAHWRKAFEGKYLGSWNLYNDQTKRYMVVSLKIDKAPRGVSYEEVIGQGGKKEACLVLRFEGKRLPFILSVTNGKILASQFGTEDPRQWPGREFKLGTERKKVKGVVSHVLRVMSASVRGEELKEMLAEPEPADEFEDERQPGED